MKTVLAALVSSSLTTFAVAGELMPTGDVQFEIAGSWGGPVNTVDLVDDTAYIGSGRRLVITDISDHADIVELGAIELLSPVTNVALNGDDILLLTTKHQSGSPPGLYVRDVSGPADFAQVLGSRGPCPRGGSCPADLTGDGIVSPADLAQVLGAWG